MNPLALIKMIFGVFSIGKLFWNAGKVIRYLKTVGPIVKHMVTEKHLPSACESKEFLHATAELVRSGIVSIPGVDENAIADAIDEIDKEIECKAA